MLFNEWNNDQQSIFAELDDLNPDTIIGKIGVTFLTAFYKMTYGERTVPKALIGMSNAEVATIINGRFYSGWERLEELYEMNLPIGFESETTIDETYVDTGIKKVDNNNINKVTAFNDDEFTQDNGSDTIINETDNRERDKQYRQKKISIESIAKQRKMIYNENISNVVCMDVSKIVALSIY